MGQERSRGTICGLKVLQVTERVEAKARADSEIRLEAANRELNCEIEENARLQQQVQSLEFLLAEMQN